MKKLLLLLSLAIFPTAFFPSCSSRSQRPNPENKSPSEYNSSSPAKAQPSSYEYNSMPSEYNSSTDYSSTSPENYPSTEYNSTNESEYEESESSGIYVPASSGNTVYICTGPYAEAYHNTTSCRGLSKCSGEIREVTEQEAINMGRHACGYCY
jgi:hypothetical protein